MLEASDSTYTQWLVQTTLKSGGDGGGDGAHTVLQLLITLRNLFSNMRELMRRMGGEAGVEIEPPAQTILADKTEALKGVLSSGVPGAGGNDAIFAIVLSNDARSLVEGMWSEYGTGTGTASQGVATTIVCPLMLNAENGLEGGVRLEKMEW